VRAKSRGGGGPSGAHDLARGSRRWIHRCYAVVQIKRRASAERDADAPPRKRTAAAPAYALAPFDLRARGIVETGPEYQPSLRDSDIASTDRSHREAGWCVTRSAYAIRSGRCIRETGAISNATGTPPRGRTEHDGDSVQSTRSLLLQPVRQDADRSRDTICDIAVGRSERRISSAVKYR